MTDKIWMGWYKYESGWSAITLDGAMMKDYYCVGDSGKAYGFCQFDYRYGLVPFMQECVDYSEYHYGEFKPYIQLGAGNITLIKNEGLMRLFKKFYDKYTDEFCDLQNYVAYNSYYKPSKEYIEKNYGFSLDDYSPAVKGSVFSMSIRSGAISAAKRWSLIKSAMTDEVVLNILYATYYGEDAERWTSNKQLGSALEALKNNVFNVLSVTKPIKEVSKLEIINSILTQNPIYTQHRTITPKGLMLHSIGCPQPSAMKLINSWNSPTYTSACVHAFIDANTGKIYQTLPWNYRGGHCRYSGNDTHLGIEMCEPACIKYTGGATFTCSDLVTAKACAARTYNSAIELFAFLCQTLNLDPLKSGVIVSHAEGYKHGIASNHADPEHLWNQLGMGYTMSGFRQDVKRKLDELNGNAQTLLGTVKVLYSGADGVNIRITPQMDSSISKVAKIDEVFRVVSITADKEWYKLDSGLYITTNPSLVNFTPETIPCFCRVNSLNGLNVRQTPNSSNSQNIFVAIPNNTYVVVTKQDIDGWVKIQTVYNGKSYVGYVYAQYLNILNRNEFEFRKVIDSTGLNIRADKKVSATKIATMGIDFGFYAIERYPNTSWGFIWCGETIGYSDLSNSYSKKS